ncbi:MAG: Short-chain dehydrogenase/reductase SDR?, partial [uncultured Arthrobacter sp.]
GAERIPLPCRRCHRSAGIRARARPCRPGRPADPERAVGGQAGRPGRRAGRCRRRHRRGRPRPAQRSLGHRGGRLRPGVERHHLRRRRRCLRAGRGGRRRHPGRVDAGESARVHAPDARAGAAAGRRLRRRPAQRRRRRAAHRRHGRLLRHQGGTERLRQGTQPRTAPPGIPGAGRAPPAHGDRPDRTDPRGHRPAAAAGQGPAGRCRAHHRRSGGGREGPGLHGVL